jgi:hypothetical protein
MRKRTHKLQYLMEWNDMEIRQRLNTHYSKSVLKCSVSEALISSDEIIYKTSDRGRMLVRFI